MHEMCGIHAIIEREGSIRPLSEDLKHRLVNRGPDQLGQLESQIATGNDAVGGGKGCISLRFTSTVLALRGDHVSPQPFQDATGGSILCWNGEAWSIGGESVLGNDGEAVFSKLIRAPSSDPDDAVLGVLRDIRGPFAFVFFHKPSCRLYYGRDRLGRRSLLVNNQHGFVLSSISESAATGWTEVEADGIYVLDIQTWGNGGDDNGTSAYRKAWSIEDSDRSDMVLNIGCINMVAPTDVPPPLDPESPSIQFLRQQLTDSVKTRVLNVPRPPSAPNNPGHDADARIAVLFSGGLDCAVLARLAGELLPPDQSIDLLNVAFENPRVAKHRNKNEPGTIYEACPDRITGKKSFAELTATYPSRKWRFVAIDVPYTETLAHRSQVVSLMYPHNTEMDLSIACALFFAARGIGAAQEHPEDTPLPYTTPARVLLSGLGADELFGGYSRHLAAFEDRGYPGLVGEIKLDVSRLGKRNLGRDDRAMAHWGREVRFPYLDENFVKWAIGTPIWEKCDFGNPESASSMGIEPGKRILRLLALELGMGSVSREKKRAVSQVPLTPSPKEDIIPHVIGILATKIWGWRADKDTGPPALGFCVDPIRLENSQDGKWADQRNNPDRTLNTVRECQ